MRGWSPGSFRVDVEVYPLCLRICKSSDPSNFVMGTFSKVKTIGHFKSVMCQRLSLKEEDVRVWDYFAEKHYKLLDNMTQDLESAQIISGQPMMLEERGPHGHFIMVARFG
mmetsp:Transcript_6192/g.8647  ORF Transcript_6192/g.8647 Transcript_6192/m.8647 type:complete len:111 (-) Transcript_6192:1085-1417(-)